MATEVTSIPTIMRSNQWPIGASLMDSWFARNVNVAPAYDLPDTKTILMDK